MPDKRKAFETIIGKLQKLLPHLGNENDGGAQQAQQAREELRHVVGYSVADEIVKLDRLKTSGSITDQEFAHLRAKLVQ